MTREEAIKILADLTDNLFLHTWEEQYKALHMAIEALSAEAVQLKQIDTMVIADALRYLAQDTERHELDRARAEELREQILQYGASMCHAEAVQRGW